MRTRWAAIGAAVAVSFGGGAIFVANAGVSNNATSFVPIKPCRLLDTRTSTQVGARLGRIGPTDPVASADQLVRNDITVIFDPGAATLSTSVSGVNRGLMGETTLIVGAELNGCDTRLNTDGGADYDPTDIDRRDEPIAVALNVTAIESTANSFITVYPWQVIDDESGVARTQRPFVSHMNPIPSHGPITNSVTVALADTTASSARISGASCDTSAASYCAGYKAFRIYNDKGLTHVIVDVVGYYVAG
jgi:hypothetical protein